MTDMNTPSSATSMKKSLLMVLGLASFIVLTMAGVFIALNQTQRGSVAPTAPESRPAAAGETSCTLTFNVTGTTTPVCGDACKPAENMCPTGTVCAPGTQPQGEAFTCQLPQCADGSATCTANNCQVIGQPTLSCVKEAFVDQFTNTPGNYSTTTKATSFAPGDNVVYQVTYTSTGLQPNVLSLTDVVNANATFMDSNCGASAYNNTTRTLTCPGTVNPVQFRVKLSDSIANNTVITNTAQITGSGLNPVSCAVNITVTREDAQEVVCGEICNTGNVTCPTNHSCSTTTGRCVYNPCLENGVDCDALLCVVEGEPQPVGCNGVCSTNSDCTGSNLACISGINRCRLTLNPNSTTCEYPEDRIVTVIEEVINRQTVTQTQTVTKGGQPVTPEELPVAGSSPVQMLMAGFGMVVVAAAALFFLL